MSWEYATDLNGQPAGWSTENLPSEKAARLAGKAKFDGPIWVAWVVRKDYAAQLPPARQLLSEMQERAADAGADTSCFDLVTEGDVVMLEDVLRNVLKQWEVWLSIEKRSTVVIVENLRRYEVAE